MNEHLSGQILKYPRKTPYHQTNEKKTGAQTSQSPPLYVVWLLWDAPGRSEYIQAVLFSWQKYGLSCVP